MTEKIYKFEKVINNIYEIDLRRCRRNNSVVHFEFNLSERYMHFAPCSLCRLSLNFYPSFFSFLYSKAFLRGGGATVGTKFKV